MLLISDAKAIFPFLLQDKMIAQGANFNEGTIYLENISHDKNIVTGQNPWSTWVLAETMIKQLGYTPKYREITGESNDFAYFVKLSMSVTLPIRPCIMATILCCASNTLSTGIL